MSEEGGRYKLHIVIFLLIYVEMAHASKGVLRFIVWYVRHSCRYMATPPEALWGSTLFKKCML